MTIGDVGEKKLIAEIIRPLFNPKSDSDSVGDDCAIISITEEYAVCISTDRVPADLIAYRLGIIDLSQLGYYLAVLNISDLAAAGASPKGLLLNLGLPKNLPVSSLKELLAGIAEASKEYECPVVGGDLSDAVELNLVATSIGILRGRRRLYRSGALPGDCVFCCDTVGITPTAFAHYLQKPKLPLGAKEEEDLCANFLRPQARTELGSLLRESGACSAVMDNTDGLGQSLLELAEASGVAIELDSTRLPISPISKNIAAQKSIDLLEMVLGPGADFQLIGTARIHEPGYERIKAHIQIIGSVRAGTGVWMRTDQDRVDRVRVRGWNYYTAPDT